MSRRRARHATCTCLLLALVGAAGRANADLQDDIARLAASWRSVGRVQRFSPHVEERGDVRLLFLPRALTNPTTPDCTTVAALSAVNTSFVLRFLHEAGSPRRFLPDEQPLLSVAGAVSITRCGAHKASLARLAVEMRSPRAVLEVVAAGGPADLPALRRVLPHRDPGPQNYFTGAGPAPGPAPLFQRIAHFERKARRERAQSVKQRTLRANSSGAGQLPLTLEAGCHRITLMDVSPPGARAGADVDLELVWAVSGEVLATDSSPSSDASVSLCVADTSAFQLRFGGAWPRRPLTLLHARWALPRGLVQDWDARTRARIAQTLWHHHLRLSGGFPVYQTLGVMGDTLLPFKLEPDACYVLAAASMRTAGAQLAVTVDAGVRTYANRSATENPATALAFCARGSSHALIDVEAGAPGDVWLLAIWQSSRRPLGAIDP